jgi:AraC-like DNA-binding protein
MSGRLMECVADLIASGVALGNGEKLVLFGLARFAGNDGSDCFPSLETIATVAGMDRRTVMRCLDSLVGSGRVSVEHGGGRGRANRYRLHLEQKTGAQRPPLKGVNGGAAPPFKAPPNPLNRGTAPKNRGTAPPDSIKTLRKERSEEQTSRRKEGKQASQPAPAPLPEPLADQANVLTVVGTYLGNMRASIAGPPGRWPQRTQAQQIEELTAPPKFVRPQPVEPVRSVEEQLAILLGPAHAPAMEAVV